MKMFCIGFLFGVLAGPVLQFYFFQWGPIENEREWKITAPKEFVPKSDGSPIFIPKYLDRGNGDIYIWLGNERGWGKVK